MTDFTQARHNMVESQIRPNRVTQDGLIAALQDLPREQFVPAASRAIAYVDEDIPVKPGRYLMEPRVLARLVETAEIGPGDTVLDIGCGTGYSTAVLARLCNIVVALESDDDLAAEAEERVTALGIDNCLIVRGDLTQGHPDQAPYDVIIFGGAVAEVPEVIGQQLAEGGRMLAVVNSNGVVGKATLLTKYGGVLSGREIFDAATPYLPGFAPKQGFTF